MKKARSLILALMLCLGLAAPAPAAEPAGGKCGGDLTWSLGTDGTLTISGTGAMDDYDYDVDADNLSAPWADRRGEITSVVIEKGVTGIGRWAFYDCGNLTGVTIPDSVTMIGEHSFRECGSLTNITLPDGITAIKYSTFYGCGSLTSVTIPSGVTIIEGGAFLNCAGLTCVVIPDSVTRIETYALYCENLKDVYYSGDESQFARIEINGRYNAPLFRAAFHYNSIGPVSPDGVTVTVNGKAVTWTDAAPFIDGNDRTMVPFRAVAETMGLTADWDAAAREAFFTDGSKTIYFPIGGSTARVSEGEPVEMDTAAVIVNGRTYAPIRALAEYFGCTVVWDAAARTVIITA